MEGDAHNPKSFRNMDISIHSLHTEGDNCAINRPYRTWKFQSTPSTRRETQLEVKVEQDRPISIHSLHTEGDDMQWYLVRIHRHFNPLPPHGGRHLQYLSQFYDMIHFNPLPPHGGRLGIVSGLAATGDFNPLPPHGGRQLHPFHPFPVCWISIHSLHTEGDYALCWCFRRIVHFNPLPPHGGRRYNRYCTGCGK